MLRVTYWVVQSQGPTPLYRGRVPQALSVTPGCCSCGGV